MIGTLKSVLCILLLVQPDECVQDTKGKTFALAFFPEYYGASSTTLRNLLYLASGSNGTCTVSYHDDSRKTTQITLVANDVIEKALQDNTQVSNTGTGIEPKAIYVNCSVEIALFGFDKFTVLDDASDTFTVLPINILGTKYAIASVGDTAFVGVVSTKASTQLSIKIKSTCVYTYKQNTFRSGDVINITLAYGDVFRLGSHRLNDNCDLGGTEIQSSDPVSVFSGSLWGSPYKHIVHEVPPVSASSSIIIVPGSDRSVKTTVRVVATQNNTLVNITSEYYTGFYSDVSTSETRHLNENGFIEMDFSPDYTVIIFSTQPVLVSQIIVPFVNNGGTSLFIPGINLYEKQFLIKSFPLDYSKENPKINVVTDSASTHRLLLNGVYPRYISWRKLRTVPYSVGTVRIQAGVPYNISSTSPLLVLVSDMFGSASYRYNAGYQIADVKDAVSLMCLAAGWIVSLDMSKLSPQTNNPSDIYMNEDSCVGTLYGGYLVFNKTYGDCNTRMSVSNGTLIYSNTLVYAPQSYKHLTTNITCSVPDHGTDSVHIKQAFNSSATHAGTSGVFEGSTVHITLYQDPAYAYPVKDTLFKAKLGQPVYVQVSSARSKNTVMVIQSCDAHLEGDNGASYPLIDQGCANGSQTEILFTRNYVTRFKFVMFDLPNDEHGIFVTCHVNFCETTDVTGRCQQPCHKDPYSQIIIG